MTKESKKFDKDLCEDPIEETGVNKKQFWGQNIQKQVYPPYLEAFKAKQRVK